VNLLAVIARRPQADEAIPMIERMSLLIEIASARCAPRNDS